MIEDLQKIFDLAIRAYLPPLDESNSVPVLGIAFANVNYPKQIEKILAPISDNFNLSITPIGKLLNLKVSKSSNAENLFDAMLNYEEREYEWLKSHIKKECKGAFVVGAINHNGQFMIVSENPSSFSPYQVESFNIL
uniref:hypothetical protein n=1 Tax=Pedobacter schmidteae TaxID=2201271 RepID=UPI000EAC1C27|nr:hypothetical protein [Pedobacter schmidteae]